MTRTKRYTIRLIYSLVALGILLGGISALLFIYAFFERWPDLFMRLSTVCVSGYCLWSIGGAWMEYDENRARKRLRERERIHAGRMPQPDDEAWRPTQHDA